MTRGAIGVTAAIVVLMIQAATAHSNPRIGEGAGTLLFAGYGAYCIQNFLRCREVHCAITGPGFLLAAVAAALPIFGVPVGIGIGWLVFIVTYALGMAVEAVYAARTGSHYLKRNEDLR